jgi:DNA-directed RNA polymerase subunit M/transcription elongation factor TFIIS
MEVDEPNQESEYKFESMFCVNCHNILYPAKKEQATKLIYICKVCLFEVKDESVINPIFYSKDFTSSTTSQSNILPNSKWAFDYTLKRKKIGEIEYVIVLDSNLKEILIPAKFQ